MDAHDEERGQHVYEFVIVPSFVAVISYNSCEPVFVIKIIENGLANEEMKDRFGHSLAPGQLYLKGNYLKLVRSRNISRKTFSLIPGAVLCNPEVFDIFVDVDDDLIMCKDSYLALVA